MAVKLLKDLMLSVVNGIHGAVNAQVLDASTEWIGCSFTADRTGNIDRIKVRSTSLTGTSPTYVAGIEAGGQIITGTWLGATATGRQTFSVGAAGFHEITLAEVVPVVRGTRYLGVVKYSSGTINGINSVALAAWVSGNTQMHPNVPYNTGSNTRSNSPPIMSFRYDTGEWQTGMAALSSSSLSWSSSSSPKWRGNKFVAPCTFVADRVMLGMRGNAGGDYKIVIVTGAASSSALEVTCDVDAQGVSTNGIVQIDLGADFTFTEGETYRIFVEPTTTTAINSINKYAFDSNAEKVAMFGPYEYTTATALGTNTDLDTEVLPLYVVPKSFESGSGGGRTGFGSFG